VREGERNVDRNKRCVHGRTRTCTHITRTCTHITRTHVHVHSGTQPCHQRVAEHMCTHREKERETHTHTHTHSNTRACTRTDTDKHMQPLSSTWANLRCCSENGIPIIVIKQINPVCVCVCMCVCVSIIIFKEVSPV